MHADRVNAMRDDVTAALAGRPLVAPGHRTRGRCRRCARKNDLREQLGLHEAVRAPTFSDGERVVLTAVTDPDGVTPRPPERRWVVTAAHHHDHPQRSQVAAARQGVVQARLLATVRAEGWVYRVPNPESSEREHDPDALVLRDLEVEWLSPADEGTPADTDVNPGGTDPTEPRPDWPAAENAWRRRLVRRHDDE